MFSKRLKTGQTGRTARKIFFMEIGAFGNNNLMAVAVKEEIKFWLIHPTILPNFAQVAPVNDMKWVKKIIDVECALIPTLEGETFSLAE